MASTDPVKSDKDEETLDDEAEARVDADEEPTGADEDAEAADSSADAAPDADDGESGEAEQEEAEQEVAAADEGEEAPAKPAKKKGKGRSKDGMTAGARLAAAKAAKAARKAAKRGKEIKEQDPIAQVRESELAKKVEEAGSWAAKNRTAVIAAIAAIVIGLGGWLGWRSYSRSQAEAAGTLLADALEIAQAEIVPEEEESEDAEADADAPPTFPTEQARAEAALEAYRDVVSRYPNADAAVWARLGEADALAELGQLEEAREAYETAEREGGTDPTVVWRALEGRAFTLEAEEKWDEAIAVYEELAALDNHRYQPVANYHIARMYMAKGETDRAKETLQTVVDTLNEAADDEDEQGFAYALSQAQTRLHTIDPSAAPPPRPSGASPFGGMGGMGGPGGNLTPEQMQELIRRFQQQQQQGGAPE